MIKLRAEWRQVCPKCGIQLVVDFLADAAGCRTCPWCGNVHDDDVPAVRDEIRGALTRSMNRLESKANQLAGSAG